MIDGGGDTDFMKFMENIGEEVEKDEDTGSFRFEFDMEGKDAEGGSGFKFF